SPKAAWRAIHLGGGTPGSTSPLENLPPKAELLAHILKFNSGQKRKMTPFMGMSISSSIVLGDTSTLEPFGLRRNTYPDALEPCLTAVIRRKTGGCAGSICGKEE